MLSAIAFALFSVITFCASAFSSGFQSAPAKCLCHIPIHVRPGVLYEVWRKVHDVVCSDSAWALSANDYNLVANVVLENDVSCAVGLYLAAVHSSTKLSALHPSVLDSTVNLVSTLRVIPRLDPTHLRLWISHSVVVSGASLYPVVAVNLHVLRQTYALWWAYPDGDWLVDAAYDVATRASLHHSLRSLSHSSIREQSFFQHVIPDSARDSAAAVLAHSARSLEISVDLADKYESLLLDTSPAIRTALMLSMWLSPLSASRQAAVALAMDTPRWYDRTISTRWRLFTRMPSARLRLAFASTDLRRHAMGIAVEGLFSSHNRSRVRVAAYHFAQAGHDNTFQHQFGCLPEAILHDWTMSQPLTFDLAPKAKNIHGMVVNSAVVSCNPVLWGQTSRLAAAADAFYMPGTWRTPTGFCNATLQGMCHHIQQPVDGFADVLHHMATFERPHIYIDLNGISKGGTPTLCNARPAPIIVHAYSGPLSMADPLRADWMIQDSTALPADFLMLPLARRGLPTSLGRSCRYGSTMCALVWRGQLLSEAVAYVPAPAQAMTHISPYSLCSLRPQSGPRHPLSPCHASMTSPACAQSLGWCGNRKRLRIMLFHMETKFGASLVHSTLNIMRRSAASTLWLSGHSSAEMMRRTASAWGVHPSRIVIAPRSARELHLRRLLCDGIYLDTWEFGAHSTAAEALAMGLPVLTRPSKFGSRAATSYLESWRPVGTAGLQVAPILSQATSMAIESLSFTLTHHFPASVDRSHAASQMSTRHLGLHHIHRMMWSATAANMSHHGGFDHPEPALSSVCLAQNLERAYRVMWDVRRVTLPMGYGWDAFRNKALKAGETVQSLQSLQRSFHIIL